MWKPVWKDINILKLKDFFNKLGVLIDGDFKFGVLLRGGSRGSTRRPPPTKIGKNMVFGVKSWFFTRNTKNIFAPPSVIGKNMIFFGVKSWFFTRNTPTIFAPPSALRNFFKFTPLTWNPGSAHAATCFCSFPWRWYRQSISKWFFVKESMSVPFSSFPWILVSPKSGQRIVYFD